MPEDRLAKEVGARVRAARVSRGLTQRGLSESSGVPVSTISDVESGARKINYEHLMALALSLGIPIARLFGADPRAPVRVPEDGDIRRVVGINIRAARERRGLTIPELAEATGVHHETLRRWERGWLDIGLTNLTKVAKALNVDTSLLLAEDTQNLFTAGWKAAREECFDFGCQHNHPEIY